MHYTSEPHQYKIIRSYLQNENLDTIERNLNLAKESFNIKDVSLVSWSIHKAVDSSWTMYYLISTWKVTCVLPATWLIDW